MSEKRSDIQHGLCISEGEIRRVARLVRLRISDEEVGLYREQLGDVISWFGMLAEVDTDGVVPATNGGVHRVLPLRGDHVENTCTRDDVIANAPESDMGFFTVRKVIE